MRLLIIGGTRFVGRHLAEIAVARGHDVTLFHRGRTGTDVVPQAHHVLGDRDRDLGMLADQSWDATIDTCAYVPRQVAELADALGDRCGRVAFVSSISAYAEPTVGVVTEDAPLAILDDPSTETVTGETYGGLKALCEQVAGERFGQATLVIRPTYVIGPHDYTHRFGYWVDRIADGGQVLAPGPRERALQVIDARDQATWTIEMLERGAGGVFHTVHPAPPCTFESLLQTIVDTVGPPGTALVWVDSGFLTEHGVDGNDLPLWDADDTGMACDPARAAAAGLDPRELALSIADTLDESRTAGPTSTSDQATLTREREAELLARWASRG